jgi:capsular polysaccharide transport system permease protein
MAMNEMPYRIPGASDSALPGYAEPDVSSKALRLWKAIWARISDLRSQFALIVVLPTLLAALYFGVIASKRYLSHAEYVVQGANSHHAMGLSALLTTMGISRTADDASAIENFLQSRDAVRELDEAVDLRKIFGRPEADFISRYPRFWQPDTFERLYSRSQDFISVVQDSTTGITTLEVTAFRPEDAKLIADKLLSLAEEMVNRMNDRIEADTVGEAEKEVARAQQEVLRAQAELTAFRNKEFLVDPVAYAGVLLSGISTLSVDRSQTEAQIKEMTKLSPENPAIAPLRAKVDALQKKIADERTGLAGDDAALAEKVSTYERLGLMRQLADKNFGTALLSLEAAEMEAERQQVYVEQMVSPNLPDEDIVPERLRDVATVFVTCFAAFSMLWLVAVGAKDHAQ